MIYLITDNYLVYNFNGEEICFLCKQTGFLNFRHNEIHCVLSSFMLQEIFCLTFYVFQVLMSFFSYETVKMQNFHFY